MGNSITPNQNAVNINDFRINRILLVEADNLIKRLSIRLMGKLKSAFSPNSKGAIVSNARKYCKQANQILERDNPHTMKTFADVLKLLKQGIDEFKKVQDEYVDLLNTCINDYNTALDFYLVRVEEEAKYYENMANNQYYYKNWYQAKSYYETSANYYRIANLQSKQNENLTKANQCQLNIYYDTAESWYRKAESCRKNEDFNTAISNLQEAKAWYQKANKKQFVEMCNKYVETYRAEKAKMIERCNAEGLKLYNAGVAHYSEINCILAKEDFNKAIVQYRKAENYDKVSRCENYIRNCEIVYQAIVDFREANKLLENKKPAEAMKKALGSKKVMSERCFINQVSKINDFITKCQQSINELNQHATELLKTGKASFYSGETVKAKQCFEQAKLSFANAGNADEIKNCEQWLSNCSKAFEANSYYNDALANKKSENFNTAISLFIKAKGFYSYLGLDNDVADCNEKIKSCEQCIANCKAEGNRIYNYAYQMFVKNDINACVNNCNAAKTYYRKAGDDAGINDCDWLLQQCNVAYGANRNYNNALDAKAQENFIQAENLFAQAKQVYANIGITSFVTYCENNIQECRNLRATYTEYGNNEYDKGMQNYRSKYFNDAKNNFIKAKDYFEKSGNQTGINNCNDMINKCGEVAIANTTYNTGLEYDENGNYEEAIKCFNKARKVYESYGLSRDVKDCDELIKKCENAEEYNLGIDDYHEGVDYENNGQYSEAIDCYNNAINHFNWTGDFSMVRQCKTRIKDCNNQMEEDACKESDENFDRAKDYYERGDYIRAKLAVEDARLDWYNGRECDELLKDIADAEYEDSREDEETDEDEYGDD